MIFSELRFFLFLAIAFGVHWTLRGAGARKWWLLACSYVFYGAWDWRFLGLIFASTVIDYYVALGLDASPLPTHPRRRRVLLWVSLAGNLGLLGFFKYFGFFVSSAVDLLHFVGFEAHEPTLRIVLPVGISFYTFQTLSYTLDVYAGRLAPSRNFRDFALFVAFFPQLVAGPIVRAIDFLPQLDTPRRWVDVAARSSVALFACGFVKKAVVADNVAILVDQVFTDPGAFAWHEKWLGMLLYAIQTYCDFSGYSDMAIATAALFGYRLTLNFDFPYAATSMTELWRRWHISLTTWLRDYVYFPLGGSRKGPGRTYVNLVLIFIVCGLWHGATWMFLLWGMICGVFLIFERLLSNNLGVELERGGLHRHAYTMWGWMIGLACFRSPDLETFGAMLTGMHVEPFTALLDSASAASVDPRWWGIVLAFFAVHACMYHRVFERPMARVPDFGFAVLLGLGAAVAFAGAATAYQPFIYFQF